MYSNDREKMRYALSQMKDLIFDVMHDWIQKNESNFTLKNFFMKIENYMRLHLLERSAKKKLLIISMKNSKIVNAFYHRIFKLWKRAKVFDANCMNQFNIVVRSHLVNALMSRRYTDMKAMFEMTKEVKNQKNDLNSRYSRSNNKNKKENREQASQKGDVRLSISNRTSQNPRSKMSKSSSSDCLNAQFKSISIKSADWIRTWYKSKKNLKKLNIEKKKNMLIKQKRCWSCRRSNYRDIDSMCVNFERHKRLNITIATANSIKQHSRSNIESKKE
jgi:hypothetical protein